MNFEVLRDSNDPDNEEDEAMFEYYESLKKKESVRNDWISVDDRLPEDRTIVWIYAVYDDSSYDDVKDRVSIGIFYNNEAWSDILDFPFADDYTVLYWMPMLFPEKPSQKV